MTLIITAATKHNMIQVCDRRLTMPDGTLVDSLAHKVTGVTCLDARFSIAYTGIACTGALYVDKPVNRGYRRPEGYSQSPYEMTDEWLVDLLGAMGTNRLSLTAIHDCLMEQARVTFSPLQRGLTFVLSGYWVSYQFVIIISNMEDAKGNRTPIGNTFQSWTWSKPVDHTTKESLIFFHGARAAVHDTIGRRLKKITRRIHHLPGAEVVKDLELLIRATARHPTLGKYVGRDCSHAIIAPRPGITLGDDQAASGATMPSFILGGMAFKGITVRPVDDGK